MYIEDDIDVREYIAEFLQRFCKTLYLASNAMDGWKLYEKNRPDIILLDINLPGENGIEFADNIRKTDHETRIVITTAYTDENFLLSAVELGLTRYLVKPMTSKELIEALGKAVDEYCKIKNSGSINLGEGFVYHCRRRLLLHNGIVIELRKKEIELLEFFIKHSDETLSYELLQYAIWESSPMSKDAIRAQIRNLRKKTYPQMIVNVNGFGYRLNRKV